MFASPKTLFGLAVALLLTTSTAAPLQTPPAKRSDAAPVMAGPPVVFGLGTYPRANRLSDGSVLGVYTAFSGGDNVIQTVLSGDGGQSWYFSTVFGYKELR